MKEAVSSPAVASCSGKLYVIGGGPDDETCSDKVRSICVLSLPQEKHKRVPGVSFLFNKRISIILFGLLMLSDR